MIKKLLYGTVIIAGLVSCNDDYTDWANPQSNAAKEAAAKFAMTVTPSVSSIDFASETADSIQLFTSNLQDGQTSQFNLTISAADKSGTSTVVASPSGKVASYDLKSAVSNIYGKAPTQRTLSVAIQADVTITTEDGSIVVDKTTDPYELNITLDAPYISEHYYIIGSPSKWDLADQSLPFTHSSENVYDDPVFTVTFPATEGEIWFAIADDKTDAANNDWSTLLGCAEGNGLNGDEGKIIRRNEASKDLGDCSWKVSVSGDAKYIRMTINMMDYTYKIEKLNFADYIYEVGNNNNWGNDGAETYALQGPNYDGKYYGAINLKSGFKFRSNATDWNGSGNWGANENGDEGVIINSGSSNDIKATDGFYMVEVDLVGLTYKLTASADMGIIGDAQPGGWSTDTPMTYDETEKCWVATNVALEGGKSIKFRTQDTWNVVNIGGTADKLVFNSNDNIPVAESGTYTVKLYLESVNGPYFTMTK